MWYMCMMEFNPGIKKKEFLPPAANCMQLKDIIWSEISWPEEKITRHVLPYVQKLCGKREKDQTQKQNKQCLCTSLLLQIQFFKLSFILLSRMLYYYSVNDLGVLSNLLYMGEMVIFLLHHCL